MVTSCKSGNIGSYKRNVKISSRPGMVGVETRIFSKEIVKTLGEIIVDKVINKTA